jgi:hypothetical protein
MELRNTVVAVALSARPGLLQAQFDVVKTKPPIGHVGCRSRQSRREDSRNEVAGPHNASSEHSSQDLAQRGGLHRRLHALSHETQQGAAKKQPTFWRMVRVSGDAAIMQHTWDLDKATPEISLFPIRLILRSRSILLAATGNPRRCDEVSIGKGNVKESKRFDGPKRQSRGPRITRVFLGGEVK